MLPWIEILMGGFLLALFFTLCGLAGRYTRTRDVKKVLGDALFIRPQGTSDKKQ